MLCLHIQAEKLIVEIIKEAFPTHQMIGEEGAGGSGAATLTDEPTWMCDPLDGTTVSVNLRVTVVAYSHVFTLPLLPRYQVRRPVYACMCIRPVRRPHARHIVGTHVRVLSSGP